MALFNTAFGDFHLKLVGDFQHDQLPFNQADQYLLNELTKLHHQDAKLSIVNDQHGALATALEHLSPTHFHDLASFNDALSLNFKNDNYETHPLSALSMHESDIALLRLPKNLLLFEYILKELGKSHQLILVGGMQKYFAKGFYDAAQRYFNDIKVLPGVKKAKCMILQNPINDARNSFTKTLDINEFNLKLVNCAGTFSYDKLDIGSRFFLENFPEIKTGAKVLDLACGNGVLGIYSQLQFKTTVHYIDDSAMALEACASSLKANGISENCRLYQNNSLDNLDIEDADIVLCNPPFHQEHSISDHIARKMIKQSKRALANTGKLYLIGNKHLGYGKILKNNFTCVKQIAQNNKFILHEAQL